MTSIWAISKQIDRPITQALSATNITLISATIRGKLTYDAGFYCEVRFRFRKVGDSFTIRHWVFGFFVTNSIFSEDLTGLEQDTLYEYSVQAVNMLTGAESEWSSSEYFLTSHPDWLMFRTPIPSSYIEIWDPDLGEWRIVEENTKKIRVVDTLHKPKYAEISVVDVEHEKQNSGIYKSYCRLRITDYVFNQIIFFGRVEFIEAKSTDREGPHLILQCRDFLQELTENKVEVDFSGPETLGGLVKDIVDYYVYTEIYYSGAGGFASYEYDHPGNWITVGTGKARIIYVDPFNKTLVVTDVINAESFVDGGTITEYWDETCIDPTGITDTQDGDLFHNIDTSEIPPIGDIEEETTRGYLRSSLTPLEAISQLCLHSASDGVYDFFLEEGTTSESMFPPVFRLFKRGSRPSGGAKDFGLTVKYRGEYSEQEREMHRDYSFPIPQREIYTEAKASCVDEHNRMITSVRKAGDIAYQLKIFKKRCYQALEHYSQTGIDHSVDRFIEMTGTTDIQRGNVPVSFYPIYHLSEGYFDGYYIVRSGELVHVINDRITFTAEPGIDMIVTEIDYEEPPVVSNISLLEIDYGISTPEYTLKDQKVGTEFPDTVDVRVIDEAGTKELEIHKGTTPPTDTTQLWFDTNEGVIKKYISGYWKFGIADPSELEEDLVWSGSLNAGVSTSGSKVLSKEQLVSGFFRFSTSEVSEIPIWGGITCTNSNNKKVQNSRGITVIEDGKPVEHAYSFYTGPHTGATAPSIAWEIENRHSAAVTFSVHWWRTRIL